MTQGFYEQLGVDTDADAETLRAAYHTRVARLSRRLRQLREQRGDTEQLELAREQLDEAWAVLADPARRQRYDAMLAFLEQDDGVVVDTQTLWQRVGARLVPPDVAAATRLVARLTRLRIEPVGESPLRPSPAESFEDPPTHPTLAPDTMASETEAPTETSPGRVPAPRPRPVARLQQSPPAVAARPTLDLAPRPTAPPPTSAPAAVTPLPTTPRPHTSPGAPARVTPVVVAPTPTPAAGGIQLQDSVSGAAPLAPDDVARLVDTYGYSGLLLRAVREARGVTLEQVAERTRISVRYLRAIEADAHDRLPTATFVRGYVREIARLHALDDEAVVAGYMRRMQS